MMSVFERDFYSEYEARLERNAQADYEDYLEKADWQFDSLEEEAYVNGYGTTDFGLGYRYGIC